MSNPRPAGPYPLPGVSMTSWMIRFDKEGRCVSPATQAALLASIPAVNPPEIIFFSHGWQTDFDGAKATYAEFLQKLEALTGGDSIAGRNLLFVGVTWPSKWLPGTEGPVMAGPAPSGRDEDNVAQVLEDLASALPTPEATEVYELAAAQSLNADQARRLAELLIQATSAGAADAAELDDGDAGLPDTDAVLAAWRLLDADTFADSEEPDFNTPGSLDDGPAQADAAGLLPFDPLDAIRIFSLYQMKDRAGRVGGRGVATLLSGLAAKAGVIYAVGHSFGCKVMLSAVKRATLPSKDQVRMLLMQPALSHLAFSKSLLGSGKVAGYADVPGRVKRIYTTFSANDGPLHDLFHLALLRKDDLGDRDALIAAAAAGNPPNRFAALGGYGPREVAFTPLKLTADDAAYGQAGETIVALDGSGVILGHSEIRIPATARALRKLMG